MSFTVPLQIRLIFAIACMGLASLLLAEQIAQPTKYDPFVGDWQPRNPERGGYVAQIISTGSGAYQVNMLAAFDDAIAEEPVAVLRGQVAPEKIAKLSEATAAMIALNSDEWSGELWPDCCGSPHLEIFNKRTKEHQSLIHLVRSNAMLRIKLPATALVLIGSREVPANTWDVAKIKQGETTTDYIQGNGNIWKSGELEGAFILNKSAAETLAKFADCRLHLEFRMWKASSCASVKLGRFASIGLMASYGQFTGQACGVLLGETPLQPLLRAERAPMEWQSLDVDIKAGLMTVTLNGQVIHEAVSPAPERANSNKNSESKPLILRQLGAPVEFRNIWVQQQ